MCVERTRPSVSRSGAVGCFFLFSRLNWRFSWVAGTCRQGSVLVPILVCQLLWSQVLRTRDVCCQRFVPLVAASADTGDVWDENPEQERQAFVICWIATSVEKHSDIDVASVCQQMLMKRVACKARISMVLLAVRLRTAQRTDEVHTRSALTSTARCCHAWYADLSSDCAILRVLHTAIVASTAALHERFAKPASCRDKS